MAIPDFQSIMLPLLKFAASRAGEVSTAEAYKAMVDHFKLSPGGSTSRTCTTCTSRGSALP